jgi:ribose transport system ATP-binding protein
MDRWEENIRMTKTVPLLSVRTLSKSFGEIRVLRDISFDLLPGQIHALVGENGSGKSTFIKCLSGFYAPSANSTISIDGKRLPVPYSASQALEFGFSFVHQVLGLIPTLSVTENLGLQRGYGTALLKPVNWQNERKHALSALSLFGEHIDPDESVGNLPQADKTLVAIARGLSASKGRVLVLDEPTAALPFEEVDALFRAVRRLAASGVGVIYVSHRLGEVLSLADHVTALRDGQVVASVAASELDERKLVRLIIGKSLDAYYPTKAGIAKDVTVLKVRNLGGNRVKDVSFDVRAGEILGIAGLLGSGRSELGRLLYGAQTKRTGEIELQGRVVDLHTPADGLKAGISYVPEDRLGKGGIGVMTVAANYSLSSLSEFWRGGWLRKHEETAAVAEMIEKFNVRPKEPSTRFSSLSGGNQQKVIIARALRTKPKLLILDEPAQGVDIGSKTEIYETIENVARNGTAVVTIDADFNDLCRLCHRILVVRDGRVINDLSGEERSVDRIAELVHVSGDLQ